MVTDFPTRSHRDRGNEWENYKNLTKTNSYGTFLRFQVLKKIKEKAIAIKKFAAQNHVFD